MSVIDSMRADARAARAVQDRDVLLTLTTMLGVLEGNAIVRDGEKVVPDEIAVPLIKSEIKTLHGNIENRWGSVEQQSKEIEVLNFYIPKEMDEEQIRQVFSELAVMGKTGVGPLMGHLKANYPNQYDGKKAAEIAKREFS